VCGCGCGCSSTEGENEKEGEGTESSFIEPRQGRPDHTTFLYRTINVQPV
jgi:hypothetical protein